MAAADAARRGRRSHHDGGNARVVQPRVGPDRIGQRCGTIPADAPPRRARRSTRCGRSGCCRSPTRSTTPRPSCCRSIFLKIIDEFGVGVEDDRLPGGDRQLRVRARPAELRGADPGRLAAAAPRARRDPVRWRVRGPGAAPTSFATFAIAQHPVADRRLAAAPGRQRPARRAVPAGAARLRDQRPHRRRQRRHGRRRAHRRAAHRRGRLARRVDRRSACPAIVIAIAILLFVRERGTDRAAAVAGGSVRDAFGRILARPRPALALPDVGPRRRRARPRRRQPVRADLPDPGARPATTATSGLMYGALIVFSVPMPLDRRLAVRPARAQAADRRRLPRRRRRVRRLPAGRLVASLGLWIGIVADGPVHASPRARSSRRSSPTSRRRRPATRRTRSTSRWRSGSGRCGSRSTGVIIDAAGESTGLPIVFVADGGHVPAGRPCHACRSGTAGAGPDARSVRTGCRLLFHHRSQATAGDDPSRQLVLPAQQTAAERPAWRRRRESAPPRRSLGAPRETRRQAPPVASAGGLLSCPGSA